MEQKSLKGPITLLVVGTVINSIGSALSGQNELFGLLCLVGLPIWIVGLVKLIKTIKYNVRAKNAANANKEEY